MITVSIVMPTYNRSTMLAEAVRSIIGQTWTSWELIIVDDGSDDDSSSVVAGFADPRIRWVPRPHSGNYTVHRLYGASLGHGEWIAFMDSDDLWEPEKLEVQLDWLSRYPEASFTFCNAWHFGETNHHPRDFESQYVGDVFLPMLRDHRFIFFVPTLVFKRSACATVEKLNYPAIRNDMEFFFLLAATHTGLFTNQRLMRVRKHSGGDSRQLILRAHQEHIEQLKWFGANNHLEPSMTRVLVAQEFYRLGLAFSLVGEFEMAVHAFAEASQDRGLLIKSALRWLWAKMRS